MAHPHRTLSRSKWGRSGSLYIALEEWIKQDDNICAAVLFGSSARMSMREMSAAHCSDFDIQIITEFPEKLERANWRSIFSKNEVCLQATRPATGNTTKITLIFDNGQADLVLVPIKSMHQWKNALENSLFASNASDRIALNEIKVCIMTGYRFIKGAREWASFYRQVDRTMPGVRLDDVAVIELASVFLSDLLWVYQKLERRELLAAQFVLHRSLSEIMFRLLRELRLRCKQPIPSFGLARKLEEIAPTVHLNWVRIDARLTLRAQTTAARKALEGFSALMKELVPTWRIPTAFDRILARTEQDIRSVRRK